MQSWRRYTILGVLAFLVGVAGWSSMAWSDTVGNDVPRGQTAPAPVKFDCGHLLGSHPSGDAMLRQFNKVRGPLYEEALKKHDKDTMKSLSANGFNKLSHRPCSGRTDRRVLVFVDGVVGIAALVVLLTRFSVHDPVEASNTSS